MKYFTQTVPIQNANEDKFTLAEWVIGEGNFVKKGQIICVIETTKTVYEVPSNYEGYLFQLATEGEECEFSKPIAIISEENKSGIKAEYFESIQKAKDSASDIQIRKYTKKAEILAKRYGIDIHDVKSTDVVQASDVLNHVKTFRIGYKCEDLVYDKYSDNIRRRIIILGGGVGAVQIIDAIMKDKAQRTVGILDDDLSLQGKRIFGIEILGPISMADELINTRFADGLVISFSKDLYKRAETFIRLKERNLPFSNVIDPSAQIHSNVQIGSGNVILCNSSIGPCTSVGDNNFLSSYTNIDHHNLLGSHCTFGPGVMTSGEVQIHDYVKFGTGIYIEPCICIGRNSIISSGSIINFDILENSIVKRHVDLKLNERKRSGI